MVNTAIDKVEGGRRDVLNQINQYSVVVIKTVKMIAGFIVKSTSVTMK